MIGLAGAAAASRALTNLLYSVRPGDPMTFTVMALVVAFTTVLAAYLPARRAYRNNPTETLRMD